MNSFTKILHPDLLGRVSTHDKMTFAVKANIGCGYPASSATPSLRDWVPKRYSPVVQSLVKKGHQIAAMANMHELASGISSESSTFGDVENPYKPGHIPGGSSSGSAAAVAVNAVTFALGSDTAGSMRIPAALCGVVGYRPTTGLYPTIGMCPLASTTDTIGIFAQKVSTIQQVHSVIKPAYSPERCLLSGVRMGVPRDHYYSTLDSQVSLITEKALQLLAQAGVELVECNIKFSSEYDIFLHKFLDLIVYETGRLLPAYLKEEGAPVNFEELCKQISDPVVKKITSTTNRVSDERYRECCCDVQEICQLFVEYFDANKLDCFVVPTTILPAVKRPIPMTVHVSGQKFETLHAFIRNSIPQAIAGVPCISLPSGLTPEELPVGLELVGSAGSDSTLLDLAAAVQEILPPLPQLSYDDFKERLGPVS